MGDVLDPIFAHQRIETAFAGFKYIPSIYTRTSDHELQLQPKLSTTIFQSYYKVLTPPLQAR